MATASTATTATIMENRRIAKNTYRLRFEAAELAKAVLPGQFFMVRPDVGTDPLLGRPFALYDTALDINGTPAGIDIVYLVMGNGTQALAKAQPGERLRVWGPLGQPFPHQLPERENEHLLIVAGGIGQTPFPAVIKWLNRQKQFGEQSLDSNANPPAKISFAYGVRSADYFGCLEDFSSAGVAVHLATDDGSLGHRGFVTEIVEQLLDGADRPTSIFGCGPEPMLKRLAAIAASRSTPCWVSLETKMACGYGVCFSCVCPLLDERGWDYRRVCLEGPVFNATTIAWEQW